MIAKPLLFTRQNMQTLPKLIINAIEADGGTVYSKACLTTTINNATDEGQLKLALNIIAAIEADSGTVYSNSCLYSLINNNIQ